MPKVIAFANQKGGVGKTSVILGVASAASANEVPTLVIDLDPQANATAVLGAANSDRTINEVLYTGIRGCAAEAVSPSSWPAIDIIPATLALADREAQQDHAFEQRLRDSLQHDELNKYELILIDCQPSVGKLVLNALVASDQILIITEPTMEASAGVAAIQRTIATARHYYNEKLSVAGVVINKVDLRTRENKYRIAEIEKHIGSQLWSPYVPYRAAMSESRGSGVPVHSFGKEASDLTAVFDTYLALLRGSGQTR